jgi:hypothetical protein
MRYTREKPLVNKTDCRGRDLRDTELFWMGLARLSVMQAC